MYYVVDITIRFSLPVEANSKEEAKGEARELMFQDHGLEVQNSEIDSVEKMEF